MAEDTAVGLDELGADDLAALRLSSQVLAHKAALAGLPRVAMFFEAIEAEVAVEIAARGQRGQRGPADADPWRRHALTAADRAAIAEYLELLSGNDALSADVRRFARRLLGAAGLHSAGGLS